MMEVKDVMNIIRDLRDVHRRLLIFEVVHNHDQLEIEKYKARIEVLNCLLDEINEKLESKEAE